MVFKRQSTKAFGHYFIVRLELDRGPAPDSLPVRPLRPLPAGAIRATLVSSKSAELLYERAS
jgi:hypothetical protein